jgi:hypothetical protein
MTHINKSNDKIFTSMLMEVFEHYSSKISEACKNHQRSVDKLKELDRNVIDMEGTTQYEVLQDQKNKSLDEMSGATEKMSCAYHLYGALKEYFVYGERSNCLPRFSRDN